MGLVRQGEMCPWQIPLDLFAEAWVAPSEPLCKKLGMCSAPQRRALSHFSFDQVALHPPL